MRGKNDYVSSVGACLSSVRCFTLLPVSEVVEVISPSEHPGTVQGRLRDYFTFGTQQVWLIYPEKQQIVVQYPDGTARTLSMGETLNGGDVLPDFTLDLHQVFEENRE